MARTTEAEIRKILEVDAAITDFDPFINAANAMVTEHCTDIEASPAAIVETWLAAHLVCIRDTRPSSEAVTGAAGVSIHYQFKLDLGLACTMYGQMAMTLDPTGGLARWNKQILSGKAGVTVGVTWLGTEDTEDEDE